MIFSPLNDTTGNLIIAIGGNTFNHAMQIKRVGSTTEGNSLLTHVQSSLWAADQAVFGGVGRNGAGTHVKIGGNAGIISATNNITAGSLNANTTITATGNITSSANVSGAFILGDGSQLTNIPHPADAVTSVNNKTGVVTLTTADITENTNLYYTNARADARITAYTGAMPNMTGNITTTANVSGSNVIVGPAVIGYDGSSHTNITGLRNLTATGNIQTTGQFESGSGGGLNFYANSTADTGNVTFDKAVGAFGNKSRIVDLNTTGYSVADADLGTANVTTASVPRILTAFYGTAGSTTITCLGLAAGSGIYIGLELAGGSFTSAGYLAGDSSLENGLTNAGTTLGGVSWPGLAKLSGWRVYDVTTASTSTLMGVTGHITGISGNTVTLSEPLKAGVAGAVLLIPGAFSSTQNFGMVITGNPATNALTFNYALSLYNQYDLPQTLSNVALDRISYGSDSSVNMANVVMRHSADIQTGPDSALRIPRAMLIGANATPDLLSVGSDTSLPATSTLGITIEQDGLTDFGPLETTPQMKLMLNNYKTNSLGSFTAYPKWTEFLGQSGNASVDMPYLGAPNFNFKSLGGTKSALSASTAGDIPGRLTWNTLSVGGGSSGSDQFNPPASITAMVGGAGALTQMANTDMYFQSTSATSYRNGPYVGASQGSIFTGSIPQTFLASKSGTTVLAANQAGVISLRPVRDYADSGSASTFVDNRYADNLHEYHSFVDVGYDNALSRTGAMVTIQAKSGQTNGATPSGSDFNYDSKGEAVLRLKTHNANSTVKSSWDIEATQASGNLSIINSLNVGSPTTVMHFDGARVFIDEVVRFQNLTTTEINNLPSPQAGDTVYNTTLNQLCFYNGSAWQKITSATM